jgi:hypothetical protein
MLRIYVGAFQILRRQNRYAEMLLRILRMVLGNKDKNGIKESLPQYNFDPLSHNFKIDRVMASWVCNYQNYGYRSRKVHKSIFRESSMGKQHYDVGAGSKSPRTAD